MKSADLADGIGSGSGNYNISQGKKIRKLFFDIFKLDIAFFIFKAFIGFALAAQMNHLEIL